jgi:SRSO17 transposase
VPSEEVQLVQVQADAEVARVAVGRVANTSELLLRVACSSWHVRDAWSAKEASSPRPSVLELILMGTSLSERIMQIRICIFTTGMTAI